MEKIDFPVVIVSDIHLVEEADERGCLLRATIARLDPSRVRYFVLLGDIFDFCFGRSAYFRRKFAGIGTSLSALAARGVKVIFVQGNHEFALADLNWPGVEFVSGRDRSILVAPAPRSPRPAGLSEDACQPEDARRAHTATGHEADSPRRACQLALCHGDRLAPPWHYRLYCALTRSHLFTGLVACLPQQTLDRLCLYLSARSRARDRYRRLDHRKIMARMEAWLATTACQHGVIGHYHLPYNFLRADQSGRILGLKSWDEPNLLAFDGVEFFRLDPRA